MVGGNTTSTKTLYYFALIAEPQAELDEDVVSACEAYFRDLLRLVYNCYVDLAPVVNAQWHFTMEHFASLGLTIEDAEEELGFPRGWTGSAMLSEDARWRLLRQGAEGCGIQAHFESWLGLSLPHPDA